MAASRREIGTIALVVTALLFYLQIHNLSHQLISASNRHASLSLRVNDLSHQLLTASKRYEILTMVTTIKDANSFGARFVLESWSRLYPTVRFRILTESSDLARMIYKDYPNLIVVILDKFETDYKFYLSYAIEECHTNFVGFVNGDIAFSADFLFAVKAFHQFRQEKLVNNLSFNHFVLLRRRINTPSCKVMASETAKSIHSFFDECVEQSLKEGTLYVTDAQDYWIFDRDTPIKMHELQPYRIGGRAFDNIFTGLFIKHPEIADIDCTKFIHAIHVNHGDITGSHSTPASQFNMDLYNTPPHPDLAHTTNSKYIMQSNDIIRGVNITTRIL